MMGLNFEGVFLAICTFVIIGLMHPVIIKLEYYSGTRFWWLLLLCGLICCGVALFVSSLFISALLGVAGASFLWGIGELFEQKQRVKKGCFPMNPKRLADYED